MIPKELRRPRQYNGGFPPTRVNIQMVLHKCPYCAHFENNRSPSLICCFSFPVTPCSNSKTKKNAYTYLVASWYPTYKRNYFDDKKWLYTIYIYQILWGTTWDSLLFLGILKLISNIFLSLITIFCYSFLGFICFRRFWFFIIFSKLQENIMQEWTGINACIQQA